MAMIGIGDRAQTYMLQSQNALLKARMQQLSGEVTSGITSDPGKALRGDYTQLSGLEATLSLIDAWSGSAKLAELTAQTQQSALQALDQAAGGLGTQLLQAGSSGTQNTVGPLAEQARAAFATAVSALNTRAGNRNVFSGAATDQPALASADAILAEVTTAVAGQVTTQGVVDAVKAWFASPTGYAALAYKGSATPASPIPIGKGQSAPLTTTALDPAIVDTLTGLATAAMIDAPDVAGNIVLQAGLATAAGQSLLTAGNSRATLAAEIGITQNRIAAAQTRNTAEQSALQAAKSKLLTVDQYQAASDLQVVQTQLEMLYALTARIGNLSLVNFLP